MKALYRYIFFSYVRETCIWEELFIVLIESRERCLWVESNKRLYITYYAVLCSMRHEFRRVVKSFPGVNVSRPISTTD